MAQGFGDRLARGGNKAAFPTSEAGTTEERFSEAVGSFDSAGYLKRVEAEEQAARERKAQRLIDEEKVREQQDAEREARRAAEAKSGELDEPEVISGRYSDVKTA